MINLKKNFHCESNEKKSINVEVEDIFELWIVIGIDFRLSWSSSRWHTGTCRGGRARFSGCIWSRARYSRRIWSSTRIRSFLFLAPLLCTFLIFRGLWHSRRDRRSETDFHRKKDNFLSYIKHSKSESGYFRRFLPKNTIS